MIIFAKKAWSGGVPAGIFILEPNPAGTVTMGICRLNIPDASGDE